MTGQPAPHTARPAPGPPPPPTASSPTASSPLARHAARLGLALAGRLDSGGSESVCALLRDDTGTRYVLKYLEAGADRVDGHGLGTFRAKERQQRYLAAAAPRAAARYLPVLHSEHGQGWSAYLLPYSPYPSLADTGRTVAESDFTGLLSTVLGSLVTDGYTTGCRPADRDLWRTLYLERLPRRRWILRRHLPADLWQDSVVVNGRRVATMEPLCRAANAPRIAALFADSRLSVPVHGDLNLRNILADPHPRDDPAFHLIDPRGTLQPWDVVYDLAKMLFTLTLFDDTMRGGCAIASPGPGEYTVALSEPSGLRHALPGFLGLLPRVWSGLAAGGLGEGPWLPRLLLAHASHVLAESACRLSDRAAPPATRLNRALGLHLYGLVLFDDLLRRLDGHGPVDPVEHLKAAASYLP
ncbi:phosphotransferase [Streptomyces sp. NPDC048737]|uniref:phosphotransferase n=1 Tax=unclassified Streptomyces TaxID=2593676 RepID=UPI0034435449